MTALDGLRPADGIHRPGSAVHKKSPSASGRLLRHPGALTIILATMLVAGTVVRLLFLSSNLNLDEGQWIYDAQLLGQGAIPFVDWTTRSPLVLLLTAAAIKVLGYSFAAGRVVSILSASATAYLLYLLGRELRSSRTGTVAAAFYLFLPFTIYQTIIVHEHPLYALLITSAMLVLLIALRSSRNRFFFLHGILISMAYLVRRSSPAYLLVEPFVCLLLVRDVRRTLGNMIAVALGAIVGLLPLIPLVLATDWRWIWFSYGPGGLAIAPPPAGDYSQLSILYNATLFLMPVVALLPIFVLLAIPQISVRKRKVLAAALLIGMLMVFFRLSLTDSWTDRYNTIPISARNQGIGMCLFTLIAGGAYLAADGAPVRGRLTFSLPLFWFGTVAAFYVILKPVWILDYSMELVPPLCLMAGVVVDAAVSRFSTQDCESTHSFDHTVRTLSLALASIYLAFTGLILFRAKPYARSWSIQGVEEVGRYVAEHTQQDEEIFTAGTAFAVAANRPVVLNVSHAAIYYMTKLDDPAPYDPYDVIPSVSDIAEYLRDNPVRYVVMDGRTRALVGSFGNLSEVISAHYVEEARFALATIYRRSGQPVVQSERSALSEEVAIGHPLHFEYDNTIDPLGSGYRPPGPEWDRLVSVAPYSRSLQEVASDCQATCERFLPVIARTTASTVSPTTTAVEASRANPGSRPQLFPLSPWRRSRSPNICLGQGSRLLPEGRQTCHLPVSVPAGTPMDRIILC